MQAVSKFPKGVDTKLEKFLIEEGICPICFLEGKEPPDKYVWQEQDELICHRCGLVLKRIFQISHNAPGVGNDTHVAPMNSLCYGNDLGNPAVDSRGKKNALMRVLSTGGSKDLGIRAIQVRGECMRSQETPISQRMKNYGSQLCKQFGYGDHVILSNTLGPNLTLISTILWLQNDGAESKNLAEATFILNVEKIFGKGEARSIMQRIWGRGKGESIIPYVPKSKRKYLAKAHNMLRLTSLVS